MFEHNIHRSSKHEVYLHATYRKDDGLSNAPSSHGFLEASKAQRHLN